MFGLPRRCPNCNGQSFFASRSGFWRPLLVLVLLRPFRCEDCDRRLWRLSPSRGRPRPVKSAPRIKK